MQDPEPGSLTKDAAILLEKAAACIVWRNHPSTLV